MGKAACPLTNGNGIIRPCESARLLRRMQNPSLIAGISFAHRRFILSRGANFHKNSHANSNIFFLFLHFILYLVKSLICLTVAWRYNNHVNVFPGTKIDFSETLEKKEEKNNYDIFYDNSPNEYKNRRAFWRIFWRQDIYVAGTKYAWQSHTLCILGPRRRRDGKHCPITFTGATPLLCFEARTQRKCIKAIMSHARRKDIRERTRDDVRRINSRSPTSKKSSVAEIGGRSELATL